MLMMSFPRPTCCKTASSPCCKADRLRSNISTDVLYIVSTISWVLLTALWGTSLIRNRRNLGGPSLTKMGMSCRRADSWNMIGLWDDEKIKSGMIWYMRAVAIPTPDFWALCYIHWQDHHQGYQNCGLSEMMWMRWKRIFIDSKNTKATLSDKFKCGTGCPMQDIDLLGTVLDSRCYCISQLF